MEGAVGCFPDRLKNFINEEEWTFAKTMPKWPHEYAWSFSSG